MTIVHIDLHMRGDHCGGKKLQSSEPIPIIEISHPTMKLKLRYKVGKGSGDFGHSGRPGELGGSSGKGSKLITDINVRLSHVSSADDPERKLKSEGWKKVGINKSTLGYVWKKNNVYGEYALSFDDYGRPKASLLPIDASNVDTDYRF
jgi:hypothetical protein